MNLTEPKSTNPTEPKSTSPAELSSTSPAEASSTNPTGDDILSRKFPKKLRGYRSKDVDAYLRVIAEEVDDLIRENHRLAEQCADLESHSKNVQELEDLLKRNLKAAADLYEKTKFDAEALIEESKFAAKENLERVERESARLRSEAAEDVQRMREGISSLENTRERSIVTLLETLNTQYRLLEQEAEHFGLNVSWLRAAGSENILRPVQQTARNEELKEA